MDLSNTKIFTVLIAIFYIFGLLSYFYNHSLLFATILLILLITCILFLNLGLRKSVILYLIFFAGFIRAENYNNFKSPLDEINANDVTLSGQVITSKVVSNKTQRLKFYLKTKNAQIFGKQIKDVNSKVLVSLDIKNNIENNIEIGDFVEIKGKLRTPKPARNPYQFDYQKYLSNNDCKNILYSDTLRYKKISSPDKGWYHLLNKFEKTRNKIIQKHSQNINSPYIEILGGIVFGDETISPDEEIKESFKNSGLLHLLAASGLNVALIFGIWWWFATLIRFPYNLSILIGAVFVILYTFMTGFPPSILRASLMLLFILFGKLIDRTANSVSLIFFVGFLILLFQPKMLFDIGFQLSFAVTFGLIVCCPVIVSKFDKINKEFEEKYKDIPRIKKYFMFLFSPNKLISIISVPLIAQLWVIPLQMHYFNTFTPYSLFANLAVVPFIGILSFFGFISSIFAIIPYFSSKIVFIFDLLVKPLLVLLVKISAIFSHAKYSMISTLGLNVFQIFNFWTLILLFILNLKNNFKNRKHFIIFLISVLIFVFTFLSPDYFKHNLEVIMFDVENADCFLIKTPENKYIMIDTGKKSYHSVSSAEIIMNKYLKSKGINHLKALIITHFDMDHCGGTIDILDNFKVDKIYIQKDSAKSLLSNEILKYLKNKNIDYETAKNNQEIYKEKDLKLTVLKANIRTKIPDGDDNETSVITLLNYKNKNILFMADAGILAFDNIKKYLPDKIDILKVGHHGAKNTINNSMLKRLKPDYALISTGINKYNHPHFSTISLLEDNEIKYISTKNYGFVKIVFDKNAENFYHYDDKTKKCIPVLFDAKENIPFHKTKYVQNLLLKL